MTPEARLDQIERLLDEERAAIRSLDGERVSAIADEKLSLLSDLQLRLEGRRDLSDRLRTMTANLRRNAVLLANARDCLRDVIAAHPAAAQSQTAPRLSMRG